MQDYDAAWVERRGHVRQNLTRMFHEAEDPAAPRVLRPHFGKLSRFQVYAMSGNVLAPRRFQRPQETFRFIDCYDVAARTHRFGQIQRRITGTGAYVQDRVTLSDARGLPCGKRARPPRSML